MLQQFDFEGADVRVVLIEENPWFVAVDICTVLGLNNTSKAMLSLDDDEFTLTTIQGSHRPTNIISESGLYSLIFRSRKPEAKKFRKWVTSVVLPSLRRYGRYDISGRSRAEIILVMAQDLVQAERERKQIRTDLDTLTDEVQAARDQILALPEASEVATSKSVRAALNERVRAYAVHAGMGYQAVWAKLYKELYYREHYNANARARGMSKLDCVETDGKLDSLYAIACEVLVVPSGAVLKLPL